MAEAEKRLGAAERDFIHTASINFLTPLRNFLEGDWKTISVRDLGPLCVLGAVASFSSELLGVGSPPVSGSWHSWTSSDVAPVG